MKKLLTSLLLCLMIAVMAVFPACDVNKKDDEEKTAKYVSKPVPVANLTYDSSREQELVLNGQTEDGTIMYSIGSENKDDFKNTIPTAKDAGEYKVYFFIKAKEGKNDSKVESLTANISKAVPEFEGTAIQSKVWTGSELTPDQPTVKSNQEIKLLNIKNSSEQEVAKAIDKGDYKFTYKVEENSNYTEATYEIAFSITDKPTSTLTKSPTAKKGLYETGENQYLVNAGEAENGILMYSINGVDFSEGLPFAKAKGEYTVTYYVKGNEGYNDTVKQTLTVKIEDATTVQYKEMVDLSSFTAQQLTEIMDFTGYGPDYQNNISVSKTEDGVLFTTDKFVADPHTPIHLEKLFEYAGYTEKSGTYIPFDADSVKSIAVKYKSSNSSNFQIYYTCGSQTTLTESYSKKVQYSAVDEYNYIAFDLSTNDNWTGKINDIMRLDVSNNMPAGAKIYVTEIMFFENGSDAEAYAKVHQPKIDGYAYMLDFTTYTTEQVAEIFDSSTTVKPSKGADGINFTEKTAGGAYGNEDPHSSMSLEKAFRYAGYSQVNNTYIPFDTNSVKSIAISLKYKYSDEFQLFYTCGSQTAPAESYSLKRPFGQCSDYELISFDVSKNSTWSGKVNDTLRFDYGRSMVAGDVFSINALYFFADSEGANEFALKYNPGDRSYYRDERAYGTLTPHAEGYYVCLFENNLGGLKNETPYATKEAALNAISTSGNNSMALQGYRVANEKGEFVAGPFGYTKLQCDLLREGYFTCRGEICGKLAGASAGDNQNRGTNECASNGFNYNNAPINPAINNRAKQFSCDRTVMWILYRTGFIDQPYKSGVCINWNTGMGNIKTWCVNHGFEVISDVHTTDSYKQIKAGDIICVKYGNTGTADPVDHTFMAASDSNGENASYRYDGGSNYLVSLSPVYKPLNIEGDKTTGGGGQSIGMVTYIIRPKVTKTNNVFYAEYGIK